MSELQVINQDLPDFLQNAGVSKLTQALAGKSGGIKRLVHKNGIWTKMVGGEPMGKLKGSIDAIVVNASPAVGRIFYAKAWSPDAEPTAPDCFSNDGRTPDAKAANPQADRCDTCPNNIKGSGQGTSKACRYSRRLAVLLADDFGTNLEGEVYQINLASKSLFGEGAGKALQFEAYSKYLSNNGKSIDYTITRVSPNEDNDNQSVVFEAIGFINKQQYDVIQRVANTDQTKALVIMTPSQADGVTKQPALAAPAKKVEVVEEEPPTKRPSKKTETVEPTPKKNLAAVVAAWSDEE